MEGVHLGEHRAENGGERCYLRGWQGAQAVECIRDGDMDCGHWTEEVDGCVGALGAGSGA